MVLKERQPSPGSHLSMQNWKDGVFHNPSAPYLEGDLQHLGSTVRLWLRLPEHSPVTEVYLRCSPDGEEHTVAAHRQGGRSGYRCHWWAVEVPVSNPRFHYRFLLRTTEGVWWYTAGGLTRSAPTYQLDFQHLAERPRESWLDQAVFYQIFPDRFAAGDPAGKQTSFDHLVDGKPAIVKAWGELPDESQGAREFYGGDLLGIIDKLPYLEQLGVNALYLNPIFTAPSSHKYDVASYREVDPHFGGDAAFIKLRRATQERGMRMMLDIVPNHCGVEHPWFQEAQRDLSTPSADFFTFHNHPHDYEAWLGIKSLPKLNYQSLRLREEMYLGKDSVFRHWLKPPFEIDGWRLDVANMLARSGSEHLGHKVLRGIRRAVKSENPAAYLLGENFFDASAYLQGDQLDASMNYRGFMMPLYHWLTGRDYHSFLGREWGDSHPLSTLDLESYWRNFRASVPWAVTRHQFNLLDSHDTPRLLRFVGGHRESAAVARFLLFTYPGVPCLYYGDEVGLDGGRDPDNRRCMPWDEEHWDHEVLEQTRVLCKARKSLPALASGAYQALLTSEQTLGFLRESSGQRVLAVARRADDSVRSIPVEAGAIPDGAVFADRISGRSATVQNGHLPIHSGWTQLWVEVS